MKAKVFLMKVLLALLSTEFRVLMSIIRNNGVFVVGARLCDESILNYYSFKDLARWALAWSLCKTNTYIGWRLALLISGEEDEWGRLVRVGPNIYYA